MGRQRTTTLIFPPLMVYFYGYILLVLLLHKELFLMYQNQLKKAFQMF